MSKRLLIETESAPGTKRNPNEIVPGLIFMPDEPVAGLSPWDLMFVRPVVIKRLQQLEATAEHYKKLWQAALAREQGYEIEQPPLPGSQTTDNAP